jgi:hypothetical protein
MGKAFFEKFHLFKTPSDIPGGERLAELAAQPCWPAVVHLYQSSYFRRLWIVQEIVLSSSCDILCAGHTTSWTSFVNGAKILCYCMFLKNGVTDYGIVKRIYQIDQQKSEFAYSPPYASLAELITSFSSDQDVTDPRDRIYGVLGLLRDGPQRASIDIDYTKPVGNVYQEAVTSMLNLTLDGGNNILRFLSNIYECPDDRGDKTCPSWVPDFGDRRRLTLWSPEVPSITSTPPALVQGDTLKLYGFIFDHIIDASENLSIHNMKHTIQSNISSLHDPIPNPLGSLALTSLWQSLSVCNPDDKSQTSDFKQGSLDMLNAWGGTPKASSSLKARAYSNEMIGRLCEADHNLGRNLFRLSQGYFGVGPYGKTIPHNSARAVQVGDVIAIIPRYHNALILRKIDFDHYCLIGNAYIGCLHESNYFKMRYVPKLIGIQIR